MVPLPGFRRPVPAKGGPLAVMGIFLLPVLWPAQDRPEISRRLVRVGVADGSVPDERGEVPWRDRLGDADLEQRGRAYASLRSSARTNPLLRGEIGSWTRLSEGASPAERDLAWTARLLLADLEQVCRHCGGRMTRRDPLSPGDSAGGVPFEIFFPGASMRTDILGVVVRRPAAVDGRDVDGAARAPGLVVDRILADTIAAVLGVRRGDRLLSLNGMELTRAADVTSALGQRAPGAEVRLVWEDPHGRRQERAWRGPPPVPRSSPDGNAPHPLGEGPGDRAPEGG